jgi:hypothetical protein
MEFVQIQYTIELYKSLSAVLEGLPSGSVMSCMIKIRSSYSGQLRVSALGGKGTDFTAFEM